MELYLDSEYYICCSVNIKHKPAMAAAHVGLRFLSNWSQRDLQIITTQQSLTIQIITARYCFNRICYDLYRRCIKTIKCLYVVCA